MCLAVFVMKERKGGDQEDGRGRNLVREEGEEGLIRSDAESTGEEKEQLC